MRILRVATCLALALPTAAYAAAWLTTTDTLSAPGSNASSQRVVVTPTKDVVVVWLQESEVHAAVRPAGGTFDATTLGPSSAFDPPAVAANAASDVIAVWIDGNVVHGAIRLAAGTPFTSLGMLSPTGASAPNIAFTSTGTAILIYTRGGSLQARTRPPGGSFGPETTIYTSVGGDDVYNLGTVPSLATDASGDAMVAFVTNRFGSTSFTETVRTILRLPNGTFGANQTVVSETASRPGPTSPQETVHFHPTLAMDDTGNAVIAISRFYTQTDPMFIFNITETGILAAVRSKAGGTWTTPAQTVDSTSSLFFIAPRVDSPVVAFDGANQAVLAWSKSDPTVGSTFSSAIRTAFAPPDATFGSATDVVTTTDVENFYGSPALARTGGGATLLALGHGTAVEWALRPPGGAFGPLAPIANGLEPPSVFALGADPDGDVVATWQRPDDTPMHYHRIEALIYDASPPATGDLMAPAGGTVGETLVFSTVATDAFSPLSFEWTLGDGASGTGAGVSHAYGAAGSYDVTVTALDTAGNVSPPTTKTIVVNPAAPVVESFAIDPTRFAVAKAKAARARASASRGTTLHFTLSQPGMVEIAFVRVRLSRRCPGSPRPRRCERTKAMGALTLDAAAGANAAPFDGRLDGKPLPRGRYRATIVGTTAGAPAPSAAVAADFTVVRR